MKVWSRTLTAYDFERACERVNREFPGCRVYMSESLQLYEGPRTRRFDYVHLRSKTGRYYPNPGTGERNLYEGELAASWTEWGWFLARLYELDPEARVSGYGTVDKFHADTDGRFIDPRTPRERQIKRALHAIA